VSVYLVLKVDNLYSGGVSNQEMATAYNEYWFLKTRILFNLSNL